MIKKLLFVLLAIFFFILVPLYSIKEKYEVFQIYLYGTITKGIVIKKVGDCYSRSSANSAFADVGNKTFEIHISNVACKKIHVGDTIYFKITSNSNIGLYMQDNGLYPFSIFGNVLAILLGLFFIFKTNKMFS